MIIGSNNRKRKNLFKFILGEAPKDNRGGKKRLRRGRKIQVATVDTDEEDELTFEDEIILIE